jgi:hypothetical protein
MEAHRRVRTRTVDLSRLETRLLSDAYEYSTLPSSTEEHAQVRYTCAYSELDLRSYKYADGNK